MRRKSQEIKGLLGLYQEEMAQLLKLHRCTVSRFELGIGHIPHHANVKWSVFSGQCSVVSPEASGVVSVSLFVKLIFP